MISILKILFWSSGFLIFYSYLGYPVFLWLVSIFKSENRKRLRQYEPNVSLLISAYNEEAVIEDKILNSLELNYPKDLLEIVVISDGSSDRTNEIVGRYADKGVLLRYYEGRNGKTACLNKALPLAKGDIIVFSDANSRYDKDAIRQLVGSFADRIVGFVSGITKYTSKDGDKIMDAIGVYSKIERVTKKLESKIGSCVGADGAIFAIRKHLYQPLKDFDINDFVIPLDIIKQGFSGCLEDKAFCVEGIAGGAKGEFNRQVRITCRTLNAVFNNINLLNPFEFGLFSFKLLSHKVCKLLVPFFMSVFFLTNLFLIMVKPSYLLVFIGQLFIYVMTLFKYRGYDFKGLSGLISASHTFTTVNMAVLMGWGKYLRGETFTTWTHTSR